MSTFEKTNETFPLFFWTQTEGSQTTQCTIETPVKDMIEMHFDFFKRPKKRSFRIHEIPIFTIFTKYRSENSPSRQNMSKIIRQESSEPKNLIIRGGGGCLKTF